MKSKLLRIGTLSCALLTLLLLLPSCKTLKDERPMRYQLSNVPRLVARPDFQPAAKAAPEWTRDALTTIANLEYELERR